MYYLALVTEAPEGGYDFTCPSIPGFTAHSDSREFAEAAAVAREVLAGHLATLVDNGGELPAERDLAELRADPEYAEEFDEAVTTVMLPAIVPAGRSLRVNLSLDENTLRLIDASARDRALTRSAFVAEACRRFVTGVETVAPTPDLPAHVIARAAGSGRHIIKDLGLIAGRSTTIGELSLAGSPMPGETMSNRLMMMNEDGEWTAFHVYIDAAAPRGEAKHERRRKTKPV